MLVDNGDGTFSIKMPQPWKNQEWQYLTDDEIKEIVGSYGTGAGGYGNGVGGNNLGGYTRELFDKIEAKIREKNDS